MDLLSDVLRVIRLTGGLFFTARLSSSWSFQSPPAPDLASSLGLKADCLALFHILSEGHCWIELEELGAVELRAGDVIILPHANAHVLASRPGMSSRPLAELLARSTGEGIPRVVHGVGDPTCRFICGFYRCDQRFNPLMGALPTLLLASGERGLRASRSGAATPVAVASPGESAWFGSMIRFAQEEVEEERPGSPAMLARISELIFVRVLRQYVDTIPADGSGWLAAVRHPEVGRALRLMHREPDRSWTNESLAREVCLSRSALCEWFTQTVGEPPMQYLTSWRMQLAKQMLKDPELSVAQVAARVGYASEVSFHRAFKRHVGQSPGGWRGRLATATSRRNEKPQRLGRDGSQIAEFDSGVAY